METTDEHAIGSFVGGRWSLVIRELLDSISVEFTRMINVAPSCSIVIIICALRLLK